MSSARLGVTHIVLSPANLSGIKARRLLDPNAGFPTAERFRSKEGLSIADAFALLSSLYFRGKITYARAFATGWIRVIAPGFGLVEPEWILSPPRASLMREVRVDTRLAAFSEPFARDCRALAREAVGPSDRIVLLGSLAPQKYVEILHAAFGNQVYYPEDFKCMGDMKRGATLLGAAREGIELTYAALAQALQPSKAACPVEELKSPRPRKRSSRSQENA